jgi:hypothetical protein
MDDFIASRRASAFEEARVGCGGRRVEVGAENFVKRSHVSCQRGATVIRRGDVRLLRRVTQDIGDVGANHVEIL